MDKRLSNGAVAVDDPDGKEWRVRRRWFAWRRWITLRDVWQALPGTSGDGRDNGSASSDLDFILAIPLLALGALALTVSVVDLAVQLVLLPFVVLARLVRLVRWPVQLDRANRHIVTLWVAGFGEAGELRDRSVAEIREGRSPHAPAPEQPAADGAAAA